MPRVSGATLAAISTASSRPAHLVGPRPVPAPLARTAGQAVLEGDEVQPPGLGLGDQVGPVAGPTAARRAGRPARARRPGASPRRPARRRDAAAGAGAVSRILPDLPADRSPSAATAALCLLFRSAMENERGTILIAGQGRGRSAGGASWRGPGVWRAHGLERPRAWKAHGLEEHTVWRAPGLDGHRARGPQVWRSTAWSVRGTARRAREPAPGELAILAAENARLQAQARGQQAWQRAMADVTGRLLAEDEPRDVLDLVTRYARELSGVELVQLAVPTPDGEHVELVSALGAGAQARMGQIYDRAAPWPRSSWAAGGCWSSTTSPPTSGSRRWAAGTCGWGPPWCSRWARPATCAGCSRRASRRARPRSPRTRSRW